MTNGTSAFAFQKPVICIYAANTPAILTSAITDVKSGLKNIVTELIRERSTYMRSELSALRPRSRLEWFVGRNDNIKARVMSRAVKVQRSNE